MSGLAERVGLKIVDEVQKINHPNLLQKELNQMAQEFYFHPDISYTAPGIHDVMTIWDSDGKKKLRKYLTMYLREAHVIFKDTINSISLATHPKINASASPMRTCFTSLVHEVESPQVTFGKMCYVTISPNSKCWLRRFSHYVTVILNVK